MKTGQPSFKERRDSVRVKRTVSVHHRLVRRHDRKVTSPWQIDTTENMSLSGLLFDSAYVYEISDIIELQVVMSGVLDIFNGFGEVVRSSLNKKGYYQVAVKYVDLKPKRRPAKRVLAPA